MTFGVAGTCSQPRLTLHSAGPPSGSPREPPPSARHRAPLFLQRCCLSPTNGLFSSCFVQPPHSPTFRADPALRGTARSRRAWPGPPHGRSARADFFWTFWINSLGTELLLRCAGPHPLHRSPSLGPPPDRSSFPLISISAWALTRHGGRRPPWRRSGSWGLRPGGRSYRPIQRHVVISRFSFLLARLHHLQCSSVRRTPPRAPRRHSLRRRHLRIRNRRPRTYIRDCCLRGATRCEIPGLLPVVWRRGVDGFMGGSLVRYVSHGALVGHPTGRSALPCGPSARPFAGGRALGQAPVAAWLPVPATSSAAVDAGVVGGAFPTAGIAGLAPSPPDRRHPRSGFLLFGVVHITSGFSRQAHGSLLLMVHCCSNGSDSVGAGRVPRSAGRCPAGLGCFSGFRGLVHHVGTVTCLVFTPDPTAGGGDVVERGIASPAGLGGPAPPGRRWPVRG